MIPVVNRVPISAGRMRRITVGFGIVTLTVAMKQCGFKVTVYGVRAHLESVIMRGMSHHDGGVPDQPSSLDLRGSLHPFSAFLLASSNAHLLHNLY